MSLIFFDACNVSMTSSIRSKPFLFFFSFFFRTTIERERLIFISRISTWINRQEHNLIQHWSSFKLFDHWLHQLPMISNILVRFLSYQSILVQSLRFSGQSRSIFLPPLHCSTPKSTRHSTMSSTRRKLPVIISRRRLQFTSHSKNENKRTTMIWLL